MKTPPGHREAPPARVVAAVEGERDRRFLIFGGVVLVAIALGFKSEIWAENQVWVLGLGLIVVAAPVLLGYLRSAGEPPAVEHYIPVALGAITLAGLASSPVFNLQLWQFAGLSVLFGVGFVVAGRLDYLRIHGSEKRGHVVLQEAILIAFLAGAYVVVVTLPFNPILKLLWILTITFLASYRSFRINGSSIAPSRAFIFAVFVAQVVTFLAWAVTALESYLVLNEGTFAVMLLFAWYINRGLVRHTVEDSFTRNVVFEYVAFAAVLIYLFVSNYQAGR
ncbi:MAG: hypothetical protein E6I39_00415 [Chloroflexi bacterium]|nr:MAG: hypothetical protein E6I98_13285 [Chloroflexota bacterium]TMF02716.1 MAG: hypothetical protein E6I39_00415 [Chloroflexota bacterium]